MTSPAPSRRAFLAASLRTTAGTFAGAVLLAVAFWGVASSALAETGRDLWLRYAPIEDVQLRGEYRSRASAIVVPRQSPTGRIIAAELQRGLRGLLGVDVPVSGRMTGDGAILVGTPASSPEIAALGWATALRRAGDAGYVIRTVQAGGHAATVIASGGDIGALYGTFHFLRLIQSGQPIAHLDIAERPRIDLRLLDHWDNLDGSIERGYAGRSLWTWAELPGRVDPRIADYARANASIGINGTVLNNVNANPESLTSAVSREGGGHRRRAPAVRHPRLPVGELRRAARARRTDDRRSARPRGRAMVADEGRRDLPHHPRLRRVPRQGQQRRPAGAAGLRPHARRRRQRARRRRRGRTAASSCGAPSSTTPRWTPTASSAPTSSSSRSTAASATTCSCRSRTGRSTSSRASRSARCSARCRARR